MQCENTEEHLPHKFLNQRSRIEACDGVFETKSMPMLEFGPDGSLHVLWTFETEDLVHVLISKEDLARLETQNTVTDEVETPAVSEEPIVPNGELTTLVGHDDGTWHVEKPVSAPVKSTRSIKK